MTASHRPHREGGWRPCEALTMGTLGTAVRAAVAGDGGHSCRQCVQADRSPSRGQEVTACVRPGARMRWAQASPPLEKGRLLGWSSSCTRFKPRRKTVPGLVLGGDSLSLLGSPAQASLGGQPTAHVVLSWAHPGESGTLLHREGDPARDSHSTSKGLPQGGGRGQRQPQVSCSLLGRAASRAQG